MTTTIAARRGLRRPARRMAIRGLAPEPERQFQVAIIDLAQSLGWLVFHPWISINSAAGWPDLFMIRGRRAVAAELKTERGRLSTAQVVWLGALRHAGIESYCWRPSDKKDIVRVLARR